MALISPNSLFYEARTTPAPSTEDSAWYRANAQQTVVEHTNENHKSEGGGEICGQVCLIPRPEGGGGETPNVVGHDAVTTASEAGAIKGHRAES